MSIGNINEWIAHKNLDMRSDILISNICGFNPLYVAPALKQFLENRLNVEVGENSSLSLSDAHFALVKLCIYADALGEITPETAQLVEVKKGIQVLCIRDDIPELTILRALRHLN